MHRQAMRARHESERQSFQTILLPILQNERSIVSGLGLVYEGLF